MKVDIKLYAILRDVAGTDKITLSLPDRSTAREMIAALACAQPNFAGHLREAAIAEGDEYIQKESILKGGLEISLFPPVSGGSTSHITSKPIPIDSLTKELSDPNAGAIITFLGTVRRDPPEEVNFLEYEAHEGMADQECEKILTEANDRWPYQKAILVHRIGRVPVGEASLFIGIASAHREEAYQVSRYILECVKHRVPIWKKSHFADGTSTWVYPSIRASRVCSERSERERIPQTEQPAASEGRTRRSKDERTS